MEPRVISTTPAPGWVGGFSTSKPAFAYPNPDLSSLPLLNNLANIALIERVMHIQWPEFSWCSTPQLESTRQYLLFQPNISQVGYDQFGRIYSIVCPQQTVDVPFIGTLNIEVSVLGQRGWVNESAVPSPDPGPGTEPVPLVIAADMEVEAKLWFSPTAMNNYLLAGTRLLFLGLGIPFPDQKDRAIQVTTYNPGDPGQPVFPVRAGLSPLFTTPPATRHPEAWTCGNTSVAIGPVKQQSSARANEFGQYVVDLFNLASGNILLNGNTLTWNVWFTAPELVDTEEWQAHADFYLKSPNVEYAPAKAVGAAALQADPALQATPALRTLSPEAVAPAAPDAAAFGPAELKAIAAKVGDLTSWYAAQSAAQ